MSADLVVMFEPSRTTPPISPRSMRPSSAVLGEWPAIRTISFWPTSCSMLGPVSAGSAAGLVGSGRGAASKDLEQPAT